jgi:chromosome segregation ATPase
MNNQQIEQYRKILADAPEGATHVDNNGFYLLAGKIGFMEAINSNTDWDYSGASHSEVRALSDIKTIVAQQKRIAELEAEVSQSDEILAEHDLINYNLMEEQDKRIVELEQECVNAKNYINVCLDNSKKQLIKRITKLEKMIDDLHLELESKKQECYSRGERIAELEKERGELKNYIGVFLDSIAELETYNLGLANESCVQQKRIAELEKLVDAVLDVEHERGGALHVSGQFIYKTPESVFKLAKQLRQQVKG